MPQPTRTRRLSLEDIHLCRAPAAILQLLARLGYAVEQEAVPLPKEEVGFAPADAAAIRNLYLLADQGGAGFDGASLQVILFELEEMALARLRSLATNLLNRGGNYLVLATSDYRHLTFVNPRRESGRVRIAKLVVDTAHPTRHDLDVLEGLAVNGQDPEALYQAHCAAFDVEKVTNRFYREYAALFQRVEASILQHNKGVQQFYEPDRLQAFAQRLLGRIMFLYFVQKKGWLAGDPRFLTRRYRATAQSGGNYYADVLEPLFLDTLNRRREGDQSPWGAIPYLNGGLFERDYDHPVYLPNELFAPESDRGILGFFDSYNFTVAEDTPVEQEVAVDPEMLGKVFENMMEERERGRSGTFYTPRPIVHYMCREALLGYLEERTGLGRDLLPAQFDEDAGQQLTAGQARAVEQALKEVRVLDPAVGTGAFLVGILHELVTLRRACHRAWNVVVPRSSAVVAEWKREFIRECLYGVDIKPEAIEIAKLRLWLSLVVDLERSQVEPLPNLDYKLMVGDSLIETVDGQPIIATESHGGTQARLALSPGEQAVVRLGHLRDRFFMAGPEERPALRAEIHALEAEVITARLRERLEGLAQKRDGIAKKGALVNWRGMQREQKELERLADDMARLTGLLTSVRQGELRPFLYRLHFFHVFHEKGGFDIVIANPPYVRMELIKEQKAALAEAYPQVYDGRADLYVYFYARGLDLLRPGGMLAFVSSDKFLRARYGGGLRGLLGKHTTVRAIIDFGELPVFQATVEPLVVVARNQEPAEGHCVEAGTVESMETLQRLVDEMPRLVHQLSQDRMGTGPWMLDPADVQRLMLKLQASATPLETVVEGKLYRGVVSGLNDAFVIDEETRDELVRADPASAEIIKPWLRGQDVGRWAVKWAGLYVIFTYHGVDIKRYPAILAHLKPFRTQLEQRATSANHAWYELQQPQMGIYPQFERPKIVYQEISRYYRFAYDAQGLYPSNKCFVIPTTDLYLLGVLASAAMEFFARKLTSTERGGFTALQQVYVAQFPIPNAAANEREAIATLVRQLLERGGDGPQLAVLEQELNQRVYRVFGLTGEETRLIEQQLTSGVP